MVGKRKEKAFILAMAICFCFVMVILAAVVANMNRSLHGFAQSAQTEAQETEGALYVMSQLRGALQGNGSPGNLGLPASPSGSVSFSGQTPGKDAAFTGKLTTQKLADFNGPDGFASNVTAQTGIVVPTDCSCALFSASVPGEPITQKYACMLSGNYPFGLIGTSGSVSVKSVRSVSDYSGQDANLIGLMADVFGSGGVSISGQLNGRAYSKSSVTAGQGGILHPNWPNAVALPPDFTSQLSSFKSALTSGTYSSSLASALDDLHNALHTDFSTNSTTVETGEYAMGPGVLNAPVDPKGGADATKPTVQAPGKTDYDNKGGTLTIDASLQVSGENQELNFQTTTISQDLIVGDNSVLHFKGDLQVTGNIYLGKHSTLVVDGATTVSTLFMSYSLAGSNNIAIISSLYGKGAVTIRGGMNQGQPHFIPSLITPASNPYPSNLNTLVFTVPGDPPTEVTLTPANPLNIEFTTKGLADSAQLTSELHAYLGQNTGTGGTGADVPGALLCSDADLTLQAGPKAAGLLNANTVTLGVSQVVGAVWAGTINASGADYRYFPYFTHAFPHTTSGDPLVGAVEQHPTAYGKLP
jgi:hypothetical protein